MQTFLPYSDFSLSAKCLDDKRLGKQRVEGLEIFCLLLNYRPEWMSDKWWARLQRHKNHPAVKMWKGHGQYLVFYITSITSEWTDRGHLDSLIPKVWETQIKNLDKMALTTYPEWLGDQRLHLSHQSNLIRKKPEHYRKYFPEIPDDMPYYWPI